MRGARRLGMAALLAFAAPVAVVAQDASPAGDWRTINRDLAATRFSPLDEINKSNVGQLALKWSYPMKGFNSAAPLVVDGTMYFAVANRIVALDADTGKELWVYEAPKRPDAGPGSGGGGGGFSARGLGYWPGDGTLAPRLLVIAGPRLVAIDVKTGKPAAGFGTDGSVAIDPSYGGTPTIFKNVAIIGAATLENPIGVSGDPRAYDVRTGKMLWKFQTVPHPGELGGDTWGSEGWKGRSGTNLWAAAVPIDAARGIAYLPIGNPAANYWGGDRPCDNLFGNSIVAVDALTGKYLWHFQTVHHDLWDTDMPNGGVLFNAKRNGKVEPVIAQVPKSGLFYELDRVTGKPALPVEERPVPRGDVPGEWYSPTQPFPKITPPLARMSFVYDDMVTAEDTTPEHAAACRAMWDKAGGYRNDGPFTPFYFHADGTPPRSTIQLPGGTGGVNWGGMAVNPNTGVVYSNMSNTSLVGWVERKNTTKSYSFDANDTNQPYDRASVDGKGPFFSFSAPISGKYDEKTGRPEGPVAPCYKPPWNTLTAVDANTGKVKWQVPLGINEALRPGKQLVGNAGNAGPTVTAGGLVFVGATNDKRFRAFDAETGKQLWEAQLSNSANANPISYRGRSGKQYVAINAGGTIVAYAVR
ncbi:MAG: outer membrane protein assembly factor BamB family protein [Croceibacterium sp.]